MSFSILRKYKIQCIALWLSLLGVAASKSIPFLSMLDAVPANTLYPTQHRLAFAGKDSMAVSWNTYEKISLPTVYYGTSPENLCFQASSNISQTYPTSTTYSNHVKIHNLKPDTTYYYRVSHSDEDFPSFNFTTPPKDITKPFAFAMVIDLGAMGPLGLSTKTGKGAIGALLPGEMTTSESLSKNVKDFKFVWSPGDIGYADYWLKEQIQGYLDPVPIEQGYMVYETILNSFYNQIENISSIVPYMVGPGNHEANCDNGKTKDKENGIKYTVDICMPGQTNFTGYQSHWKMPNKESGGKLNMWYSFDYGMAHFVQINTETDFGNGIVAPDEPDGDANENAGPFGAYENEQIDWLENDLKSVDRCKTPWVIVAGHRPWYASTKKDTRESCQQAFENILVKYNVDVAVFGHVHNYQRFSPMEFNSIDPNGLNNPKAPWYLVNGAGGHYDGVDLMADPAYGFETGFDSVYGWSKFSIHNRTHITHEFVASRNNSVLDTATLYKKHEFSQCNNRK